MTERGGRKKSMVKRNGCLPTVETERKGHLRPRKTEKGEGVVGPATLPGGGRNRRRKKRNQTHMKGRFGKKTRRGTDNTYCPLVQSRGGPQRRNEGIAWEQGRIAGSVAGLNFVEKSTPKHRKKKKRGNDEVKSKMVRD